MAAGKKKKKKTIAEAFKPGTTPTGGRVVLTSSLSQRSWRECQFWHAMPNVPKMVDLPPSRLPSTGHSSIPWEWTASGPSLWWLTAGPKDDGGSCLNAWPPRPVGEPWRRCLPAVCAAIHLQVWHRRRNLHWTLSNVSSLWGTVFLALKDDLSDCLRCKSCKWTWVLGCHLWLVSASL